MVPTRLLALAWFLAFPLLIYIDGSVVCGLGLFPTMAWDTALKYYYMTLSGVNALMILFYGSVFRDSNELSSAG